MPNAIQRVLGHVWAEESESEETGPCASVSLGPGPGSVKRRVKLLKLFGSLQLSRAKLQQQEQMFVSFALFTHGDACILSSVKDDEVYNTLGRSDFDIHHDSLNVFKERLSHCCHEILARTPATTPALPTAVEQTTLLSVAIVFDLLTRSISTGKVLWILDWTRPTLEAFSRAKTSATSTCACQGFPAQTL
ncbi:hypothetical protein J6590_032295 [Homalodisca vitripennis]|nr:hypothetical protein J6590_032295 [Homalodisca vitripennis]